MKNIPITQRVNSKSANGKVTQPILNVGRVQAPTKKMSSPFKMMSSPFKQRAQEAKIYVDPEEGNSTGGTTTKSAGKNITETKIIPKQKVERFAKPGTPEYDRWLKAVTENPSIEDKYKDPSARSRAGEVEVGDDPSTSTDTNTATNTDGGKPGAEATLFKNVGGDAQGAAERRENIRNIKNLTGQKKRNEMRLLRAGGKKGTDGNSIKKGTQAYKDAKAEIKQQKFIDRGVVIDTETRNSKQQSLENLGSKSDTNVTGVDQAVTQGQTTKKDQEEALKAKRNAGYEAAKNQDTGADYTPGKVKGSTERPALNSKLTEDDTPLSKKQNGFFGKKSPMKMKYFK